MSTRQADPPCQKEMESKYWKEVVCHLMLHYVRWDINEVVRFRAERCQKYALYQKKASNKSCSELNFIQKSLRMRTSFSSGSGARAPKINIFETPLNIMLQKGRLHLSYSTSFPSV